MAKPTNSEIITYINTTRLADWPKLRAAGDTGRRLMLLAIEDGYDVGTLADIGRIMDGYEAAL